MIRAYIRVSTQDQNADMQRQALKAAGAEKFYTDRGSGGTTARPALQRILKDLAPGDTLMVWKLDRLARSVPDLINLAKAIQDQGAGFKSLTESIDTTTAAGRAFFQMTGVFAEFERSLIAERTTAGIKAAKARGVRLGRPVLLDRSQVKSAVKMRQGGMSLSEIAKVFKVSSATIWRRIQEEEAKAGHRANNNKNGEGERNFARL